MFKQQYAYYMDIIEKELARFPWQESLMSESMAYSLQVGGKRIRPILALACGELAGGDPVLLAELCVGLEFIHTSSLIHDDLPCMDDDDFRRGKPANHKVYGEAVALLAGDALLILGLHWLAKPTPWLSEQRQLRAVREVAEAIGWLGMVGGQVLDVSGEKPKDVSELARVHRMKTGALLRASARAGAILGGAAEQEIDQLTVYAEAVGEAFQIKDDLLDVEGASEVIGKPAGSDEKLQKVTYPSLLGPAEARNYLTQKIETACSALNPFGEKAEFLGELALYIGNRNK